MRYDIVSRWGQGDPRHGSAPELPRKVMVAAVDTLLANDALDLVPMLFAPLRERDKDGRVL